MDWLSELIFDIVLHSVLQALEGSSFQIIRPVAPERTRLGAELVTDFAFALRPFVASDCIDTNIIEAFVGVNKLFVGSFPIDARGDQNYISELVFVELPLRTEAVNHLLIALRVANVSQVWRASHFEDLSNIGWLIVSSHFSP